MKNDEMKEQWIINQLSPRAENMPDNELYSLVDILVLQYWLRSCNMIPDFHCEMKAKLFDAIREKSKEYQLYE